MKTIVTHIGPDLDAIASIWLIKTYIPEWKEAALAFVPAGRTLHDLPPDDDPEVWHVDTGMGKFDHHQSNDDTCAAKLVYESIEKDTGENPVLARMVEIVNDVDHFRQIFFEDPTRDHWQFSLENMIDGWRLLYAHDPIKIVELGMECLDAVYKILENKLWAERELVKKAIIKDTKWGKAIGVETVNDEVITQAQRQGYSIAVRKDAKKGYIRIKSLPKKDIDLESVYNVLKAKEPDATWFLHASHHMVLNGSSKNPDTRPSKRSLEEIMEDIEHVK